jgi:methylated-DNA-[protein]-cysteine S-methyltransferase
MTYALDHAVVATPIGAVRIDGDALAVRHIRILGERMPARRPDSPALVAAAEQLEAWFDGALQRFDLVLAPPSTPRGLALRDGLVGVGYGQTITYGGLATKLGSASRAIGQLCARNPFPIVVPCHRVVSRAGAAERYSAGDGPPTKTWLLEFERRHIEGE